MKTTQYLIQEKTIATADSGGIRARWTYGLRLLRDPDVMSPGGGGLRHGVTKLLVTAATSRGYTLSEQEIQRRIRCARAYPTESQIRHAVTDFETWHNLVAAGFPPYESDPSEPPADHRTAEEKHRDAARTLLDLVGEQGTLFPLDQFEPDASTLKDLIGYAHDQDELTARFAERGRKRQEYLEALIDAVDGDVSVSWHEAHTAAFGEPVA